jgi:hypothetical protein
MAITGGNIAFTGYQQPDYSGVVQAAGLPMQAIAQGIDQAQDYFKQQGEKKKLIKKSDIQIDAALKLFPDLAPTLQGVRDQIRDENVPLNERAGIAESVAGLINMGTNQMQAMAEFGLKKRQLDIQEGQGIQSALMEQAKMQAKANEPTKLKPRTITLGPDDAIDVLADDYGNIYDPQSKLKIINFQGYAEGQPAQNVLEQTNIFDSSLPTDLGAVGPIEDGKVLPELARNVPVLPKEAQAAADIAGAGLIDGMPTVGLPIEQAQVVQTGLDAVPETPSAVSPLTPRSRKVSKEPLVRVNTGDSPQQQRETAIDKSLIETKEASGQVASQLAKIEEISKLLDEGVNTGFAQNVLMQGKRIFGQDVSDQEAFKAASGNVALGFINLTKGAISDKEMQYFTEVLAPSIGTSVDGNKKIVEFLRKAANKAAKVEATISNGMRTGKSAFDIDDDVQKIRNTDAIITAPSNNGVGLDQEARDALKEFAPK